MNTSGILKKKKNTSGDSSYNDSIYLYIIYSYQEFNQIQLDLGIE